MGVDPLCQIGTSDSIRALDRRDFRICRSNVPSAACFLVHCANTHFGIGITKLNCDISNKLILESNSLHTRDRLHHS